MTDNARSFEEGCHKFVKKLNKTVLSLKQKMLTSSARKEHAYIEEGLSGILDLSLMFQVYTKKHFRTLRATAIEMTRDCEKDSSMLSPISKSRSTRMIATASTSSRVPNIQSKRMLSVEKDDLDVVNSPVDNKSLSVSMKSDTVTRPPKRICKEIDVPDSIDLLSDTLHRNLNMEGDWVTVFVDGACSDNGRSKAKAGIGVWFGANCPLNVAEPVRSSRHTNNVAEIEASIRAIEKAQSHGIKKLRIKTDSMFLINCITKWRFAWAKNGWKTANGKPVINKPELEELIKVMKVTPIEIDWVHVKAHSGIIGNEAADFLARQGAEQCSGS